MQDQTMTQPTEAPAPMAEPDAAEGTPLDGIISTVEQLMADPKSVTPETLGQLKMDLEDLKTILDGEQSPEQAPTPSGAVGGLAGMIGGK